MFCKSYLKKDIQADNNKKIIHMKPSVHQNTKSSLFYVDNYHQKVFKFLSFDYGKAELLQISIGAVLKT